MDEIAARYRDRGLVVLALQVRREPEILTENVVWWLEQIRPAIPVFVRGWNPEWPTPTLPWVILFDHEGREAFAGKPERAEPAILEALAAAPDPVIGGPYGEQADLAAGIVADRAHPGVHLARLRAADDPHPEIRAMIEAAERWFARQAARIGELMPGVVERAHAWDALAETFAGDLLGERAAQERDALRADPAFAREEAAEAALCRARTTLRRCPPRGGYFPYHFTRINYTVIDDPVRVATRVRTLAELRLELIRIASTWPGTHAAEEADDLLFEHDVPELSAEEARERVARAERLLEKGSRPAELHEARLALIEVREGYLAADGVSSRAGELLAALESDRADELEAAGAEARSLREEAGRLEREVSLAGALLDRAKADGIAARLAELAKRSGPDTLLARGIAAYVADLARSFEGTPVMGVRVDPAFPGPGVRIALVEPGAGAAAAGLRPGDVVLALGGTALGGPNDLTEALSGRKPGETVEIEVRRSQGSAETLKLPLGRRMR